MSAPWEDGETATSGAGGHEWEFVGRTGVPPESGDPDDWWPEADVWRCQACGASAYAETMPERDGRTGRRLDMDGDCLPRQADLDTQRVPPCDEALHLAWEVTGS